jgi:phenylalanyl-tRNA synthetase alpha chain
MSLFKKQLDTTVNQFKQLLEKAGNSLAALQEVRVQFLGRKGAFIALLESFKLLSIEEKRIFGNEFKAMKQWCEEQMQLHEQKAHAHLLQEHEKKAITFDPTAYIHQPHSGFHPLTILENKLITICTAMGFSVAYGPEIETEYYNFDALNIPHDHPARDLWDTIWLDVPHLLMRTHTSPVQIRTLEKTQGPIAIIAPGRCYRHEATDASHDYVFLQFEGLLLHENASLSHLKAIIQDIIDGLFDTKNTPLRIRPSYFPFVEPGIEIDMACPFCTQGCSVCKKSCFIEMGGAGMIHPKVLQAAGVNAKYTGFAFGFGLTRFAMIQYHIPDIRFFYTNDYEFLRQF